MNGGSFWLGSIIPRTRNASWCTSRPVAGLDYQYVGLLDLETEDKKCKQSFA